MARSQRAPRQIAVNDKDIVVHALGPGYGESVIAVVGSRLVIGIDCCTALVSPGPEGLSYLQRVLSGIRNPYVVWLVTHFHYDHFQGLGLLLDQLGDDLAQLIVPNDYLSSDLAHDVAIDAMDDLKEPAGYFLARDEYVRVRTRLDTPALRSVITTAVGRRPLLDLSLKPRSGPAVRFKVDLWGPSYQASARLVGKAVTDYGAGKQDRAAGNHTSYILRLAVAGLCGWFLGDSPVESSLEWISEDTSASQTFLLKVAHHGALDGTNSALLEKMSGADTSRKVAIICPFRNHRLPHATTLQLLEATGYEVVRAIETLSGHGVKALTERVNMTSATTRSWRASRHEESVRTVSFTL